MGGQLWVTLRGAKQLLLVSLMAGSLYFCPLEGITRFNSILLDTLGTLPCLFGYD